MSRKIKIVTDSTADLPRDFIEKYDIEVVPLHINFPNASFLDGVTIQPKEFYPMLQRCKDILPKTSTPSIGDFTNIYTSLLKKGYDILSIHISSGLSSTSSIAEAAAQKLKGQIHVFDSKSISLGIGLQVQEAVEMVNQNLSLENISKRLNEIRERTEVLFSLDTLEYLERGGRIGKVSALLGSVLRIKPVIRVENGIYVPIDKVRNQKQAIQKMLNHAVKILDGKLPHHMAVAHGASEEAGLTLKDLVKETFGIDISLFSETGPAIGVHTGPGALGFAFTY